MKNLVLFNDDEWFQRAVVDHCRLTEGFAHAEELQEELDGYAALHLTFLSICSWIQRAIDIIGPCRERQYVAERMAELGEPLYLFPAGPVNGRLEGAPCDVRPLRELLEISDGIVEELKTTESALDAWTRLHFTWLEMKAHVRRAKYFSERERERLFAEENSL